MPTSRPDRSSRRSFLRTTATMSAGAFVARYASYGLTAFGASADAQQAKAKSKEDAVAMMRAQMGKIPIEKTQLGSGLVMLSGPGGNVVVLHGSEGKIVVDSFVQPAWPALKSLIDNNHFEIDAGLRVRPAVRQRRKWSDLRDLNPRRLA